MITDLDRAVVDVELPAGKFLAVLAFPQRLVHLTAQERDAGQQLAAEKEAVSVLLVPLPPERACPVGKHAAPMVGCIFEDGIATPTEVESVVMLLVFANIASVEDALFRIASKALQALAGRTIEGGKKR